MPELYVIAEDARLTIPDFEQRFGVILYHPAALNTAGREVVNTALTRRQYIAYNWQTGQYETEPR
jgi:hypothetical protein